MKKLLLYFLLLFPTSALADDWIIVKTTRIYQVKITQPNEKYEGYDIVWQKLLLYNRSWFVAKVVWHCPTKSYKTVVSIAGYSDEPPQVDYGVVDYFHIVEHDDFNEDIYKIVCLRSSVD